MPRKDLYFIRHGTALHNDLFWDIGNEAYTKWRDTPLTHKGFCEADNLSKCWDKIMDVEMVITSPLLRTLQTATTIFNRKLLNIHACDLLVEYPIGGNEICNYRKNKSMLECMFPTVDFRCCNEEFKWSKDKETEQDLEGRLETFKDYLRSINEEKIAVVAHSCVINKWFYNDLGNEKLDLKHCQHCTPYHYSIEL
jgi:broad specificity phosphatase PhoE